MSTVATEMNTFLHTFKENENSNKSEQRIKLIFAPLTFPLVAFFAFSYLEDIFATVLFTLFGVFPLLLLTLIAWLIDRKKQTQLRFYSNYLLLSFWGLSILWSISSRVFYPFYRENSLKREYAFHQALEKYQAELGHLPDSLSDPQLYNAPKSSILPLIGRYHYHLYSSRIKSEVKTTPEAISITSDNPLIVVASPAPAPEMSPPPSKTQQMPDGYAVSYRSFFGRVRYFGTSRHDLIRANDGFLADESEDFNEDYGETALGSWLKRLIGKEEY